MTNNTWLSDKALKLLASSDANNDLSATPGHCPISPHAPVGLPAFVYATACSHFSFISIMVDVKISLGYFFFFTLFTFGIVEIQRWKNVEFSIKGWE